MDVQSGDPTNESAGDFADELSPSAVLERGAIADLSTSVMEREFLDCVDGARTLERIADALATNPRGARRVARSLTDRGVVRLRGQLRRSLTPLLGKDD